MTNPNYTAVALVVDRSGSMVPLAEDMTGAIRSFISDQQKEPGYCTVRLDQFDDVYENVYKSVNIFDVPEYELTPRNLTALHDAVGKTIVDFGAELAAMPEDSRPGKVIFVIITDGGENASREYSRTQVFDMIRHQQDVYNWDFVFLAANQDAIKTGFSLGVSTGSSLTWNATSQGVQGATASLSGYVSAYRGTGSAEFTEDDREAARQ